MSTAKLAYSTHDDDLETRNEMVIRELPQVYYCARRMRERLPEHVELDDLVQAGVLGLIDAAARYDDSKDVKFATFAKFRINGAILDSLRKADWGSRELRRKSRAISQASAAIGSNLGRQATHDEIASDLGMSSEELHNTVNQLNSLYIVGQIAESSSEPGVTQDLIESAPDKGDNDPFKLCLQNENRALLISALELLSDREQMVIQLYYEEELTMREIAEIVGITISRISQIHTGAILKMRRAMCQTEVETPQPLSMPVASRRSYHATSAMRTA